MEQRLKPFFKQVEESTEYFIDRLRKAVAIPSVSGATDAQSRQKVVEMGDFLVKELEDLGAHVEKRELGKQKPNYPELDLPPVILGRYPATPNPKKRTILVYGHYDVQPASKEDGWVTKDPFELDVRPPPDNRMIGRGSTDDKGPILGWINVIEAHQKADVEFPVNLLICFEGMEESGSDGLDDLIKNEADKFFKATDVVCISDNYWLGQKPCLTYGLRGVSYYYITVSGPAQDLHSGVYGGTVMEPMTDLIRLMGTLVDSRGRILIPGVTEDVEVLTSAEEKLYETISFTMDDLYAALGSKTTIYNDSISSLKARWRYPSLSLHGIEGAFSGKGPKTVIPHNVTGKFSIRTVPYMKLDDVDNAVFAHLDHEWKKLKSKNTYNRGLLQPSGKWWKASPDHWNFKAASKATNLVYEQEPDMTREGGSIPVTLTFEEATKKNVLLLPMGSFDDGAHSTNEKLDKRNYIEGTKLLGAYLHYAAEEPIPTA